MYSNVYTETSTGHAMKIWAASNKSIAQGIFKMAEVICS